MQAERSSVGNELERRKAAWKEGWHGERISGKMKQCQGKG